MVETFVRDNLFASGPTDPDAQAITLVAGAGLRGRGDVLGKIAEGANKDKYRLCDSTAVDGTENPDCVLGEAVDASGADDADGGAYFSGDFSEDALNFGGTDTADTHRSALRDKGIFVKKNVPA